MERGRRQGSAGWLRRAALAALALVALGPPGAGCAPHAVYRDTFEGTRGALDAVRRHGGDAIDPESIEDLAHAATRGLRTGAGLPGEGPLFPDVTRDITRGLVEGLGQGLDAGTTRAVVDLVDRVLRRVHGEGGPSLAAALLDDAIPRLERLTQTQLRAFRAQLALILDDARAQLLRTERETSEVVRDALLADGRALAATLRSDLFPALGEGLRTDVSNGVFAVTRAAALGATEGTGAGMDRNVRPSVERLREALLGERNQTILWVLVGLTVVLLLFVFLLAYNVKEHNETQRVMTQWMRQRSHERFRTERRKLRRRVAP